MPADVFAMFLALPRGVPEAGLTFALSMFLGVSLALTAVAGSVVLARTWSVAVMVGHGASIERVSRLLGVTGALLVAIGIRGALVLGASIDPSWPGTAPGL